MCNFTPIFSKLRNDLQSLSLRRVDLWESMCHILILKLSLFSATYFPTKKQVCGGGLENVCESDVD